LTFLVKCLAQEHCKRNCRLVLHTIPLMLNVKKGSCEHGRWQRGSGEAVASPGFSYMVQI